MTNRPEDKVVNAIRTHVIRSGGVAIKVHANALGMIGRGDIVGHFKRAPFWVEAKTDKGKPSRAQLLFIKKLRQGGYVSDIVTSVEDFESKFK